MQNDIKLDDLEYTSKRGKRYNFSKCTLPTVFLRHIHDGNLSLKDANEEQGLLANELKDMGKMPVKKNIFLKNAGLIFSVREKILNNFWGNIYPRKTLDKIQYLLHLNQQKNELINLHPNCMKIFRIKL